LSQSHSVEIQNGNLTIDNGTYDENTLNFFEIADEDEQLNENDYLTNGFVTFETKDRMGRTMATNLLENKMRITYPGEFGLYGVLPDNRTTNYNLNYSWTALVPSTDENSTFLDDNNINKSNNSLAVICSDSVSLFKNSDVTFSMSPENLDAPSDLTLINVIQKYLMSNEDGCKLYYMNDENVTTIYKYQEQEANISILASNVNFKLMETNDIKFGLIHKQISDISPWDNVDDLYNPSWVAIDDKLYSSKNTFANIMGNDIQTFFENKNKFKFNYQLTTNTIAKNIESLNYEVKISYVGLDENGNEINELCGNEIYKEDDNNTTNFKIIQVGDTKVTRKSFEIPNTPMGAKVVLDKYERVIINLINPKLSGYNGLMLQTQPMNEVVLDFYLENSKGRLPDKLHSKFALNNKFNINIGTTENPVTTNKLSCRRYVSYDNVSLKNMINSDEVVSIEHRTIMNNEDLYTSYGYLFDKNEQGWSKIESSKTNIDCVFDIESNMEYIYDLGFISLKIAVNIDIPIGANIGKENVYYIDLANENGTTTFDVEGYSYDLDNVMNFNKNWDPYSDHPEIFFPLGGTKLFLTTLIERFDTNENDPSDQNQISLKIFNGNAIVAKFETDINIAANFNIISNSTPIIKVVENYGNNTETYYVSDKTESLQNGIFIGVIDGVEIYVSNNLMIGDSEFFVVSGDQIQCKPYNEYKGIYSIKAELNEDTGLIVGDEYCRKFNFNKYRGCIENVTINFIRSPTKILLKISNGITTYCENESHNLYDGMIHYANDINVLGNLGLKFTGLYSRFNSKTDLIKNITVTHGSYNVTIINKLDTSLEKSLTIETNKFVLNKFKNFNIAASRVNIYENEMYLIESSVPDLKIFVANDVTDCANINAMTHTNWSLLQILTDDTLRNGCVINGNSQLHLLRNNINVQDFTEFYSLAEPQFVLEAISTNNVDDAPYSTIPRTVLYCDMNFKDNSHHPFNGVSGMNNLKLSYISIEKYTDKKLTSVLENIYDYFNIKSNNVKIFLKSGLFLDYTYNSNTNYMIYDGETFLMQNVLSNSFESTYDSESGNATFKYKQPLTPFVSINSLKNYNKKNLYFSGVNNFGSGKGYIEIKSKEPSIKLSVYGIKYEPETDGSSFSCVFVKYVTNYTLNTFNPIIENNIKNLKILPGFRYTCKVTYNSPELGNTPYTLNNLLQSKDMNLDDLNWVQDNEFVERNLLINICAVSNIGVTQIVNMLNVTYEYPQSFLCLSTPDIMNIKSLDGSSVFRITYGGMINTPALQTFSISIFSNNFANEDDPIYPYNNSNNQQIATELFAYNVLNV